MTKEPKKTLAPIRHKKTIVGRPARWSVREKRKPDYYADHNQRLFHAQRAYTGN